MSTEQQYGDGPQVPIFVTGYVRKIDFDICMDGASYFLHTVTGGHRLKPANEEAGEALEKFSTLRVLVAVAGYPAGFGHCTYINVYSATPAEEVFQRLNISMEGGR
jgi:hypothetical protein